jgi:hypothetical protein
MLLRHLGTVFSGNGMVGDPAHQSSPVYTGDRTLRLIAVGDAAFVVGAHAQADMRKFQAPAAFYICGTARNPEAARRSL